MLTSVMMVTVVHYLHTMQMYYHMCIIVSDMSSFYFPLQEQKTPIDEYLTSVFGLVLHVPKWDYLVLHDRNTGLSEQAEAFQRLKDLLCADTVLAHFNPSLPILISCCHRILSVSIATYFFMVTTSL